MPQHQQYVRYTDDVEAPKPDEGHVIDEIIGSMTRESEVSSERYKHAVRASHAKSHGVLKGELRVLDGLSEPLRQGLFAQSGTYPVVVRLAVGPGELLSDAVSTHRGMAIKVFGAEGPKLAGHEDAVTQDFVLATGPVFPAADAAAFLRSMKGLEKAAPAPEGVKRAVSSAARAVNTALGGGSPTLDFYGHPPLHPLADTYYSQAAMRYGDHIAKVSVAPVSPELVALRDTKLDVGADPDAFRHAVEDYLRRRPAEFDIRVQLCTDLERMPVEDASREWSEEDSPYRTVARLVLPSQDAYAPARQAYLDDVLSFRPAHSLEAHRPLGSLMRARLKTYGALSAFRHERNKQPQHEPRSIDEVPD